ncbi:MAG: glycosyl hydrolase family 8 [Ignavibacteriaceae bacterium]
MKIQFNLIFKYILVIIIFITSIDSCGIKERENQSSTSNKKGAYYSGEYPNLFAELLGKKDENIKSKIDSVFNQLFYGDDDTERVYYPVEPDMAYIEDIYSEDVRTEGMSYGMMITVQLDKKEEFDRLWKWAKTYMQHHEGESKDFFAWHCKSNGEKISFNSASDGEEWFVMTLLFASARWGNGEGIYNYESEAQKILMAMLNKTEASDDENVVTNMFNTKYKQVVFVPTGAADDFTDPSYHLPHFYELWARWADGQNQFWYDVADTSRQYFKRAVNPVTGLAPDYSNFDGTPKDVSWDGGHDKFQYDAWRVAMNIAVDYSWFAKDEWAITQSNNLLDFFYSRGIGKYGSTFTLDGTVIQKDHSPGLVAMNAVACIASTNKNRLEFIKEFWNTPVPSGKYRYYNGLLFMLGMLNVSGNFRIYHLTEIIDPFNTN